MATDLLAASDEVRTQFYDSAWEQFQKIIAQFPKFYAVAMIREILRACARALGDITGHVAARDFLIELIEKQNAEIASELESQAVKKEAREAKASPSLVPNVVEFSERFRRKVGEVTS